MLERQLTKLITESIRRTGEPASWPWAIVAACAYLLRRSLRDVEHVDRVVIRKGHEVTIAVHERDR